MNFPQKSMVGRRLSGGATNMRFGYRGSIRLVLTYDYYCSKSYRTTTTTAQNATGMPWYHAVRICSCARVGIDIRSWASGQWHGVRRHKTKENIPTFPKLKLHLLTVEFVKPLSVTPGGLPFTGFLGRAFVCDGALYGSDGDEQQGQ